MESLVSFPKLNSNLMSVSQQTMHILRVINSEIINFQTSENNSLQSLFIQRRLEKWYVFNTNP